MVLKAVPLPRKCCDPDCMSKVAATEFDEDEITRRAAGLNALGDDTRLKIMKLLSQHEALCVCEIQGAFDVEQPTISHHLRILRDANLVDVQRRGTWAYYSLRKDALKELVGELLEAL